MKNKINLLIILTICQIVTAQNTILWKVTDTVNNKTSFIVGTFHQFGNSFVDSIPEIKESLINSKLAVFESIDNVENTRKMISKRESSSEIEKKLKKKAFEKLKTIAKNWSVDLYKLKPLEIRLKLQQEFQKIKCETTKPNDTFDHFDTYLMNIAEKNQIEILGLETDSLQLSLINKDYKNPDWKEEKKNIEYWIHQLTTDKPDVVNCKLANQYRTLELNYDFQKKCETDAVMLQRNNEWMTMIPNVLSSKNTFVAVGYFHLRNKCGILEQLKDRGFKIEPVMVK